MNTKTKGASKTYFVKGMHCAACEILVSQDIKAIKGVKNAKASLKNACVHVEVGSQEDLPKISKLNSLFKDAGYTFSDTPDKETPVNKEDFLRVLAIVIIFCITFFILNKNGTLMKLTLTGNSSLMSYFIFGLAAGISSCAALVGGLLLSLSSSWHNRVLPFVYFNISRLAVFAFFGGLLGYIGNFLTFSMTSTSILTLVVAIFMMIIGFQMVGIRWFQRFNLSIFGRFHSFDKNADMQNKYLPVLVGGLTFFVPCGFTLIAQTTVIQSGSFYLGAAQLFAFALGTLPILALISFTSVKLYSNPTFSKRFSLFSGLVIIFFALYTLNSQLNVLGLPSLSDITFESSRSKPQVESTTKQGEIQVMQMEANKLDYFPSQITIKANTKTRWEIFDNGSLGCARAVYARGLYPNVIYLKPGMNTVEFVSPKAGTYKISCSMGMVPPVTVTVY